MKIFFDLATIVLFFVIYKVSGMYAAVASAMIAYSVQMAWLIVTKKPIEKMQLFTFFMIIVLGGATFLFHNEMFFKWKPTAIYWLFAIIFFGSQYIGKQPIIKRLLQSNIDLPDNSWRALNYSWVGFFSLMGATNLFVAYHFDTDTWVNFKLFGIFGLTFVFIILQAFYLANKNNTKQAP